MKTKSTLVKTAKTKKTSMQKTDYENANILCLKTSSEKLYDQEHDLISTSAIQQ